MSSSVIFYFLVLRSHSLSLSRLSCHGAPKAPYLPFSWRRDSLHVCGTLASSLLDDVPSRRPPRQPISGWRSHHNTWFVCFCQWSRIKFSQCWALTTSGGLPLRRETTVSKKNQKHQTAYPDESLEPKLIAARNILVRGLARLAEGTLTCGATGGQNPRHFRHGSSQLRGQTATANQSIGQSSIYGIPIRTNSLTTFASPC